MAFDITMITGPALGAVIGYFTNYIAVKMLFRPLYPVYIGKWQLPFTPGMIPKGKARLAKAVGEAVGDVLLTKEDFTQLLLSESTQETIKNQVSVLYQKGVENQDSLRDSIGRLTDPEKLECFLSKTSDMAGGLLYKKVLEMDLGSMVGEKVTEIIRLKTQGTFLAMMLNDKMISGIKQIVQEELNQYLVKHGEELIRKKTKEGIDQFADKTVSEIVEGLPFSKEEVEQGVIAFYQRMVTDYFGEIMKHIPISQIVEEKIQAMDVKELEALTLSVMKKELNAIVNLGALIGLLIGCVNLFF